MQLPTPEPTFTIFLVVGHWSDRWQRFLELTMTEPSTALDDIKVHVKVKISALWASLMFCYIYGDYFGLYKPGTLQDMLTGKMGPLGPTTQGILLGTSAMMAIPSVMVSYRLSYGQA